MSRPVPLSLTVNGEPVDALVEPRTHLADFLRGALGLTGTHLGCEHGVCGACTVLLDGEPARSCINFAAACDGAEVRTVEGFGDDPTMLALRDAFTRHHALQCGYCTPGMLISARDIVARLPGADARRVRLELAGNLCRCTGYMGIVAAVTEVAGKVAEGVLPRELPAARAAALPRPAATAVVGPQAPSSAETAAPPVAIPAPTAGWNAFTESFAVAAAPEQVWRVFEDVTALAGCMPGAELTAVEGDKLRGRLRIRLGPIRGAFEGQGQYQTDPAGRSGLLRGQGMDRGSGSQSHGELSFRLLPAAAGGTEVAVEVRYHLAGPLAQVGRTGLVRDLARRLATEFARNLSRRIESGEAAPAAELNTASLTLAVLWERLKRLFRR
jgi:aerobic carbon-monoxide dehydrogenase small subunit